jgi:sn-glycerol 3-phosphate transport system substrate-binding protein
MFSAFAKGETEAPATTAPAPTASPHIPTGTAPSGKIQVVVWDEMSGDSHKVVENAAAAFNASQDRYEVKVIYTQNILTKMLTSTVQDRPNIIHSTGNDSAKYIAMTEKDRLYVPVQDFIDFDKYDMSTIVRNLATNYTRGGKWQCVPFGNTSTGYFYNTDILSAHGIDFETLDSYEAIYNACVKLKAEGVKRPFFYRIHVDYLNYALTAEGVQYFNNDNGKAGVPTASYFNEGKCYEATLGFFTFLKKMAQEDLLVDIQINNTDSRNMFGQGEIAIMGGYSSGIDPTIKVMKPGINFAYRPSPTVFAKTQSAGQAPGGACLFVCDVDDAWKEYGSWQFLKFFMQDEWTSKFAMASGYIPITTTGAKVPAYAEYIKNVNPSAQAVIDAQNATPVGVGYALLPYSSDYSTAFNNIFKKLMTTADYTAKQATEDLYKETKDAIEMYFLSQGKVL